MGKLDGKVAIITGGAAGMGEAHVRLFIEEGAKVVLTDINEEKGQAIAEELGETAHFIKHDVTNEEGWKQVVAETEEQFGPVDILVNNAGISPVLSVEHSSLDDYMKVVTINQVSVFLGTKYVVPSMKKIENGSIVNISSINGLVGGAFGYTDTKFAVRGMTKAAAKELAQYNIRVNSVYPGVINTPMVQQSDAFDQIQAMVGMIPLKRMAEPSEVSKLVLFLASNDSSYSTGAEFVTDGGITA
ncbi:glucose 1-dehydrogenase [Jeotgalibaca arthritidis]|uniref:Glucose 1-dehydrogenase n=1 Tax=Jeotgalibaca arthritidis TaxID=1868794 RepID=A0A6G7KAI9_9LACT|nr:glucose 1-dehydrogenase [Jeotgalibaca arthritidis]QII82284.1 glucose 1-dehydrogenase [Jeotgalibaca arthritidis]